MNPNVQKKINVKYETSKKIITLDKIRNIRFSRLSENKKYRKHNNLTKAFEEVRFQEKIKRIGGSHENR